MIINILFIFQVDVQNGVVPPYPAVMDISVMDSGSPAETTERRWSTFQPLCTVPVSPQHFAEVSVDLV